MIIVLKFNRPHSGSCSTSPDSDDRLLVDHIYALSNYNSTDLVERSCLVRWIEMVVRRCCCCSDWSESADSPRCDDTGLDPHCSSTYYWWLDDRSADANGDVDDDDDFSIVQVHYNSYSSDENDYWNRSVRSMPDN